MDYAATELFGSGGGYGPVPVRGGNSLLDFLPVENHTDAPQTTTKPVAAAKAAVSWKFLGEPYWRWLAFIIAISAGLFVWHSILDRMK